MREDLPAGHIQEAMSLEQRAYVELFHLELDDDGTVINLYFCPQKPVTWQGKTWEQWPFNISEFSQNADGEMSRPKLTVFNPAGIFTRYGHQGTLDNGIVTRYRVLRPDVDANNNLFYKNTWRISRLMNMDINMVSAELRSLLDGHTFWLPTRTYRPPEFPAVSLG